jgi:2-oxoglutarate ferredoxin oxidoreductase subunit alpha
MASRIAKASIMRAREEGIKVGLIRPIALWPFPVDIITALSLEKRVKGFIDVEMNLGQMVDDVRLAVNGRRKVTFYGRTAGMLPDEEVLLQNIVEMDRLEAAANRN